MKRKPRWGRFQLLANLARSKLQFHKDTQDHMGSRSPPLLETGVGSKATAVAASAAQCRARRRKLHGEPPAFSPATAGPWGGDALWGAELWGSPGQPASPGPLPALCLGTKKRKKRRKKKQ